MHERTRFSATDDDHQTDSGTAQPDKDDADSTSPLQGEWEGDPKRDEEDVERDDGPLDPPPEKDGGKSEKRANGKPGTHVAARGMDRAPTGSR